VVDNARRAFFMFTPQLTQDDYEQRNFGLPPSNIFSSGSSARISVLRDGPAGEADVMAPYSVLRYGIGWLGSGSTPQISGAQGGRGGVGISSPFPCRDGEQLGSLAGSHVIQLPVKVSLFG
jgi:hypothetical protein